MTFRGISFLIFGVVLFGMIEVREIILLGFFAVVLATLLSFPVNFFNKFVPRSVAVVLTLLFLLGIGAGLTALAIPTVSKQVEQLGGQIPEAVEKLRHWIIKTGRSTNVIQGGNSTGSAADVATQLAKKAIPIALNFFEALSGAALLLILAAFLAYEADGYHSGLRKFVPQPYEKKFEESWKRTSIGLKHWVGGTFVNMMLMGLLAGIGLWIAGIDGALTLGFITFFATFVPYLGAILSSIPGLLMGLAKSPSHFLYAGIVYLGVHIVEGYILNPIVMRRAVFLRPGLLLFWQALMGALFGVVGIIVATPLLTCAKVLSEYLYVEEKLGKSEPDF
jgi:predicted PurR-regulated permease PerM